GELQFTGVDDHPLTAARVRHPGIGEHVDGAPGPGNRHAVVRGGDTVDQHPGVHVRVPHHTNGPGRVLPGDQVAGHLHVPDAARLILKEHTPGGAPADAEHVVGDHDVVRDGVAVLIPGVTEPGDGRTGGDVADDGDVPQVTGLDGEPDTLRDRVAGDGHAGGVVDPDHPAEHVAGDCRLPGEVLDFAGGVAVVLVVVVGNADEPVAADEVVAGGVLPAVGGAAGDDDVLADEVLEMTGVRPGRGAAGAVGDLHVSDVPVGGEIGVGRIRVVRPGH